MGRFAHDYPPSWLSNRDQGYRRRVDALLSTEPDLQRREKQHVGKASCALAESGCNTLRRTRPTKESKKQHVAETDALWRRVFAKRRPDEGRDGGERGIRTLE